jgi:TonB family protein
MVPDLTIRNLEPEPGTEIATQEIVYTQRVRGVPTSTLSVPLRPSSRMIPPAVDAQFKGRNVYTIVIPMEHIPAYAGDWIVWFADRTSKAGDTPVVRAPIPIRKIEPVDQAPASARTEERIRLAATLSKSGRLEDVKLLTRTSEAVGRAVSTDVSRWQFQPATNGGVAIDVDVILEIPFSLPAALAANPFD